MLASNLRIQIPAEGTPPPQIHSHSSNSDGLSLHRLPPLPRFCTLERQITFTKAKLTLPCHSHRMKAREVSHLSHRHSQVGPTHLVGPVWELPWQSGPTFIYSAPSSLGR